MTLRDPETGCHLVKAIRGTERIEAAPIDPAESDAIIAGKIDRAKTELKRTIDLRSDKHG